MIKGRCLKSYSLVHSRKRVCHCLASSPQRKAPKERAEVITLAYCMQSLKLIIEKELLAVENTT